MKAAAALLLGAVLMLALWLAVEALRPSPSPSPAAATCTKPVCYG